MADVQHSDHQPAHIEFNTATTEGRMNWIFFEFWPIMVWVGAFILMIALPLTLSGVLHNPFSASDVVWSGYGLLIALEFLVALAIFIVAPRAILPYMLLLSVYGLIAAENGKAWQAGFVSDGQHMWLISNIAILFLVYLITGWFALWRDEVATAKAAKKSA